MELIFQDIYEKMECRIYIRESMGNETVITGYDGEFLVSQKINNDSVRQDFKPLLIIPISMKDELIKAFVSEGAKANLRTENENLLKGKLEATELHLKDMREFAQKLLYNKIQQDLKS
jgi:hypothetical protein